MTETEELSPETMELVAKAVRQSEKLSDGDSLDDVLAHMARTYLIANRYGGDELAAEAEEYTDTEAEAKQKEIKQKILSNEK